MVHALAAATVALLTSAASQFAPTLVEHPIACSETIYLDGSDWIASNDNAIHRSLPATVPGDIITDLQRAGRVKDPYWNVTWRDPHFVEQWNNGTYTFTKQFPSPTSASAARCRAWLWCHCLFTLTHSDLSPPNSPTSHLLIYTVLYIF